MSVFKVDLSGLDLKHEHLENINVAIQKAAAEELAKIDLKDKIVLVPVNPERNIKDRIICGIYPYVLEDKGFANEIERATNSFKEQG